jgi:hypothetical protein
VVETFSGVQWLMPAVVHTLNCVEKLENVQKEFLAQESHVGHFQAEDHIGYFRNGESNPGLQGENLLS